MSNKLVTHVGTGILIVRQLAPRTYNFRVSDAGCDLDHHGHLDLAEPCVDSCDEAMSELASVLLTAASARAENREGLVPMVEEAMFPDHVLNWVDAHAKALEAIQLSAVSQAIGAGLC